MAHRAALEGLQHRCHTQLLVRQGQNKGGKLTWRGDGFVFKFWSVQESGFGSQQTNSHPETTNTTSAGVGVVEEVNIGQSPDTFHRDWSTIKL